MIIGMLLGGVSTFLLGVIGILPVAETGPIYDAISRTREVLGFMGALNTIVPIREMFLALTVYLGFYLALHGWSAIRKTWSLIWPGAGS